MNAVEITESNIREYVGSTYKNASMCMKLANDIKVHALGLCPTSLIHERRPKEPDEVLEYRKKIYVSKTKNPISKVINSLEKIRRSQDWNIQYDADSVSKSIATGESLQDYCESNYPVFSSVTNWAFSELLRQSLVDANGIVAVFPEDISDDTGEYVKPVAKFFESSQIRAFVDGKYAVLLSYDKSTYTKENGMEQATDGNVYYVLTTMQVVRYEQINENGDVSPVQVYNHNIGKLPAWKVGGIYYKRINNDTIYESRIACMIPSLNEAAREYSDLQAEIVQHIHSEKYAYTNTECPECHGQGYIVEKDANGDPKVDDKGNVIRHTCAKCGGHGSILNTSPYGVTLIDSARAGEQQLPAPPIGYVQKSVDIAKLQDERVKQHIYDALSSVNMEFLAEVPLAQSGTAKEVDRTELNNFVNSVAEDIVRNLDLVYYFINEYRYNVIVPKVEKRTAMLPIVNVPTKYDILDSSTLLAEVTQARNSKTNPIIIRELEIDYAKKRFNCDANVAKYVETTFDLDPLFGIDEADKMTMLQNEGILPVDYIISCNIQRFVKQAYFEHPDFYMMTYMQKMDILRKYAEAVQAENKPQESINPFNINIPTEPQE